MCHLAVCGKSVASLIEAPSACAQATTGLTTGPGASTGVSVNPTTKEHVKDAANTAYNKARAPTSCCVQGSASVPRQATCHQH